MAELTVLYDEGCALCTRLAARIAQLDSISVTPIGGSRGATLLRDLTPSERYASLHVVEAGRRRRSGAEALPLLLRPIRGGGLPARLVERFPGIAATAYDFVARNRMRLSRLLQARSVSRR